MKGDVGALQAGLSKFALAENMKDYALKTDFDALVEKMDVKLDELSAKLEENMKQTPYGVPCSNHKFNECKQIKEEMERVKMLIIP